MRYYAPSVPLLLFTLLQVAVVLVQKTSAFVLTPRYTAGHLSRCAVSMSTSTSTQDTQVSRADVEANFLLPNQGHLTENPSNNPDETLKNCGVVRVNQVLTSDTVLRLQEYIDQILDESTQDVATFKVPKAFRFANVLEKQNRWDLLLPFLEEQPTATTSIMDSIPVLQALHELLVLGPVGSILESTLGPHAELYELSCLISDPGSNRQEIHPDILVQEDGEPVPVVACFVAVQNVAANMGPTVFIPNTVTIDHQVRICNPATADEMLQTIPSVISTLQAGDTSLYDPRMLHAGGSNQSDQRRRLFCVTFLSKQGDDPSHDLNPGSIRPDLKAQGWTLSQMKETLSEWKMNGGGAGL
jgi:hypothetical protein